MGHAEAIDRRGILRLLRDRVTAPEQVGKVLERLPPRSRPLLARLLAEMIESAKEADLQARQDAALDSFASFVRFCWPEAVPSDPLVWGRHMQAICDECQEVLEESRRRRAVHGAIMARAATPDEAAEMVSTELGHLPPLRLAVLVPPRHSKSIIVQRMLPAWAWLHRAQDQILALACGEPLVERDGLHLRDLVRSPLYQGLIARAVERGLLAAPWTLRLDRTAITRFMTTAGGARAGHIIGGTWTGVDADIIVIDDPIDVKEVEEGTAEMVARRMADIRGIYQNKVRDRLNSKIWGVIILIMQRLDAGDLAATFIEEGARVVCLPARYDPDHPQVYDRDWRTEVGEPLNPLREPVGVLEVEEANNNYWFMTKWQQRTSRREGGQIKREWFSERYHTNPVEIARTADEVWVSSDAAKKSKATSDRHAIHVWARKGARKYLLYRWAGRVNYPEYERVLDSIILTWAQYLTRGGVLIEDTANGTTYMQCRVHGVPGPGGRKVVVSLIPYTPKGSKQERAIAIERAGEAGQIILPDVSVMPDIEQLLNEWCGFPHAAHDDEVDATSQLFQRFIKPSGPSPELVRWFNAG